MYTVLVVYLLTKETSPNTPHLDIPHLDKVVHFVIFGLWTYLAYYLFKGKRRDVALVMITLAVVTEIIQLMTKTRHFSGLDILADLLGVLGVLFLLTKHKKLQ